jgi:hypothetical protein
MKTESMGVYYRNALRETVSLTATPLAPGYIAPDLTHPSLARQVVFPSGTGEITATWGVGNYLDTVALVDCRFTQAQIRVYCTGLPTVTRDYYSTGGGIGIFNLPESMPCTRLEVQIMNGGGPLSIGYVYAGMRTAFPRFRPGPGMGLEITGGAEWTARGAVHGLSWPVLRSFNAAFERIDRETRWEMEAYIMAVQYTVPHLIEPYDPQEYPPLYGALTQAGEFTKRAENGFYFDTAMSWREAR